jgi:hypothetical protein
VSGMALNREYLTEVLPRAARWGEGGPAAWLLDEPTLAAVGDSLDAGTARVDGARYPQQLGDFPRNASVTRALAGGAPPALAVTLAAALLGGFALAWSALRRRAGPGWYWGGLLLGVAVAPVSWAMSLVWALPLFVDGRDATGANQRPRLFALAAAFGAGLLGPWVPGAWPAASVAGVAAAALWRAPVRR